jgi:hypothetical protein
MVGLDAIEKRKILLCREWNPGYPACRPTLYRLSYPILFFRARGLDWYWSCVKGRAGGLVICALVNPNFAHSAECNGLDQGWPTQMILRATLEMHHNSAGHI